MVFGINILDKIDIGALWTGLAIGGAVPMPGEAVEASHNVA